MPPIPPQAGRHGRLSAPLSGRAWSEVMMRILPRVRGAAVCSLLVLLAGCTAKLQSKEELVAALREHCTRDQSRINPKPVLQSKLMRIAGLPHEVVQVDDMTQEWTYRFRNGDFPI